MLRLQPIEGRSAIVRGNREPDRTTEALNAPAGKIAQAVFTDPRTKDLCLGKGFPTSWLRYVNDLLSLNGDMHRHAIVFFFHSLNWFYAIDPLWTEEKLITVLEGDNAHDRDAAWAGFLWGAKVPNQKLYMRLKSDLLIFATTRLTSRRAYVEVLWPQ